MSSLSTAGSSLLERIARERALLAFEFEGTLAAVARDPAVAAMSEETRELLRVAALLYPCAVISGQTRANLLERVPGLPLVATVGCHGADPGFGPLDADLLNRVAEWKPRLEKALCNSPGIRVEDKRLCLALHYHNARSLAVAEQDALRAARRLPGASISVEHAVVHVVPVGAPTRGEALATLGTRLGVKSGVYVGDRWSRARDVCPRFELVSVRIGAASEPSEGYRLANQSQVDDFLRAVISARIRQDGRADDVEGLLRAVGG